MHLRGVDHARQRQTGAEDDAADKGGGESEGGPVHPTTCLTMKTVTMALAMKVPTATKERSDRRARPQMPWPEVQPLAEPRADADQQAGAGQPQRPEADRRQRRRELGEEARPEEEAEPGAERQPGEEDEPPQAVAAAGRQRVAGDGGNAGKPAVGGPQQRRREADENAAERGGEWGEMVHRTETSDDFAQS